jgi:hypothetical protein
MEIDEVYPRNKKHVVDYKIIELELNGESARDEMLKDKFFDFKDKYLEEKQSETNNYMVLIRHS